ncbi:hypothetical protein DWV22_01240 [Weissella confusa]|uniref:hypothetical protein n=1 Tax=Weissella confusa TaxID=1583 RepID=UPI000E48FFD2|nr:hypothetical protein [Weissella confusa]RGX49985.1 hypothetical protein DWV22_01240 [Weissella confusa]
MNKGSFTIGQLNSEDIQAVITSFPEITIPERKHTLNTSPVGIDRAILFDDNTYENRTIKFTVGFKPSASVGQHIAQFLAALDTGKYVDLRLYSDENYTYQVVRTGEAEVTRKGINSTYREVSVTLSAAPYKYVYPAPTGTIGTTQTTLTNPTLSTAKPYIKVTGSGAINLTINGTVYKFTGVSGSIELDSAMQNVWRVDSGVMVNENVKMAIGPFPVLKPGANTVKLSAGSATIEMRWRTL